MIWLRSQLFQRSRLNDSYYRVSLIFYLSDRCQAIRRCCIFLAHRPHMAAILKLESLRYMLPLASHQLSLCALPLFLWRPARCGVFAWFSVSFRRSDLFPLFSEIFKMEVCVDSVQSALNAERGGEHLILSVCLNLPGDSARVKVGSRSLF